MYHNKSIYGIIGDPVEHSLSPLMHNTAFEAIKANAEYRLFPLKEKELPEFFKALKNKESPIFGFNVTVPYKEQVVAYMDSMSPYAQKVMAVNTVVISPKRSLEGFNTDGPGFLAHLTELGFKPEGKRIAILGAGGTARAIISVLCLIPNRPHVILLYNHHREKADHLILDLSKRIDVSIVQSVSSIDDLNVELSDLLINTTPLGLKSGDPCIIPDELLHSNLFVYDVIYNPNATTLLKKAKAKGAKISNGLGMLFYQGVLAFQHWANIQLDDKTKSKMWASLTKWSKSNVSN